MDCRDCCKLLPLLVDASVPESEQQKIKAHLLKCAACCEELALLTKVVLWVKKLPRVAPPEDFHIRLRARLKEELHRPSQNGWSWRTFSLSTVAAAAILLLTLILYHPLRENELPSFSYPSSPIAKERSEALPPAQSFDDKKSAGRLATEKPAPAIPEKSISLYQTSAQAPVYPAALSSRMGAPAEEQSVYSSAVPAGSEIKTLYRQREEWAGEKCAILDPTNRVVRSQAEFIKLWSRAEIHSISLPQNPDWNRQMLGMIFLGNRKGQGYEIKILETQITASLLVISYHVEQPLHNPAPLETQPFKIFVLPQTELPVVFKEE